MRFVEVEAAINAVCRAIPAGALINGVHRTSAAEALRSLPTSSPWTEEELAEAMFVAIDGADADEPMEKHAICRIAARIALSRPLPMAPSTEARGGGDEVLRIWNAYRWVESEAAVECRRALLALYDRAAGGSK